MSEWSEQNTPTPMGGPAPSVLLLVLGPEMEEVREVLTKAKVRLRCKEEVDEVADPRTAQPEEVLLVPQVALPRLGQLPRGARWEGARPVMVICPSATMKDLAHSLEHADDAIPWPEGAESLLGRVIRLAARTRAQLDAGQLRRQVGAVQELSEMLVGRTEQDLVLSESLDRIKTWVGGDRVILLSKREDSSLLVLADTDDPGSGGLPRTPDDHPEVARVEEEDKTVLYLGPQEVLGEDDLSLSLAEGSVKAALVLPLRWEGEISGVLEVWFDAENRVDAENRTFLKRLAAILAVNLRGNEVYGRMEGQTNLNTMRADEETPGLPEVEPYKEYFQRTLDGIVVLDPEGIVMHINAAGEQITGYSSVGMMAMPLENVVLERDRPVLGRVLERLSRDGEAHAFDLDLISTSGDPITLAISPNAVLMEEGMMVLSFRDVTEARALEEDLRTTKEFL